MSDTKEKMASQFSMIVQKGLYKDADEMLTELKKGVMPENYLSEDLCVTAAFLYNKLDKTDEELYYLQQGLLVNPESPALYVSLGDYYAKTNPKQELICLYQALFYAERYWDSEQTDFIRQIAGAVERSGVAVPKTTIVILSFNTKDYTQQCLESIKKTVPLDLCQVVVVDNASTDGSVEYLRSLNWITLVENKENRGFPGGCNDGIAISEKDNDIYLLNSDTLLPPNAVFWLKMGLYENDNIGSTGSISNRANNGQEIGEDKSLNTIEDFMTFGKQMNIPQKYPYLYKNVLMGFSLMLRRSVLDDTGLIDERFNPGNSEDMDLCLRILHQGYLNVLCRNSFIYHYGSKSFEKVISTSADYNNLVEKNESELKEKLGFDFWKYFNPREDLVSEISSSPNAELNILEIGCGIGSTAGLVKSEFPNSKYTGIEINGTVASYAKVYGNIITENAEEIDFLQRFGEDRFNYVIMGDVLQYIRKPVQLLRSIRACMKKRGRIIISVPNARNWSIVIPFLDECRLPYSDDGILDTDTTRLYTENEAARLISGNGFSIRNMKNNMGDEPDDRERKQLEAIAEIFDQPDINDFLVKQYIFTAEKNYD